jgi:phage recombination protein Bet
MTTTTLTKSPARRPPAAEFSREQTDLLKRTICKDATDDELRLFLAQCARTGLDPFARQIFAVKRWDARERREVMQTQVSIDGFRLIAERSGKYAGQTEPQWCGEDGKWVDVWLPKEPPAAARVGVLRTDFREPCYAVARYGAYVQTKKEGGPNGMWLRMPDVMLSKCAEALALRKSFPVELSGLYTSDELPPDPDLRARTPRERDPVPEIGAAPEQPDREAPERPWRTFKEMLDEFAKLRDRLGEDGYYTVLSQYGVKHSNEFREPRKAAAAYQTLSAMAREYEAAEWEEEPLAEDVASQEEREAILHRK